MSRGNNDCTCRLTQHSRHRHSDSLLEVSDVCWADCLLPSGGSWCYPLVSSVVLLQTFRFCYPLVTFCRAHYACSLACESLLNTRLATSAISQNKLLPMLFLLKGQGGLLHLPLRKGVSLSILPLTCSVSSNGPYMLNHSLEMRVACLAVCFSCVSHLWVSTAGGFIIALAMVTTFVAALPRTNLQCSCSKPGRRAPTVFHVVNRIFAFSVLRRCVFSSKNC